MKEKLKKKLEKEGYKSLTYIEGKGICGLFPFAFTVGLVVGINEIGYKERYCYPHKHAAFAVLALSKWKLSDKHITEDPDDPYWIKKKGEQEYTNPLNSEYHEY